MNPFIKGLIKDQKFELKFKEIYNLDQIDHKFF